MKSTIEDPILTDLYLFREEQAAANNYDVSTIMEQLIEEQEELEKQGRRFASYPPRHCQQQFPFARLDVDTLSPAPQVNQP